MTISAYVIRREGGEWRCLVHMHRKLHVLMQIGGHIELNETPWQSVEHELREESGFTLNELSILQPRKETQSVRGAVTHPVPFSLNTHTAGPEPHFHSDLCFAFEAAAAPAIEPEDGESEDLRWLSLNEMQQMETSGEDKILGDVIDIYTEILANEQQYERIAATEYSLNKPSDHWHFDA